jgi:hypothetical protein
MCVYVDKPPVKAVQVVAVADRMSIRTDPLLSDACWPWWMRPVFETQDTVQGAQQTKARRFRPGWKPRGEPPPFLGC